MRYLVLTSLILISACENPNPHWEQVCVKNPLQADAQTRAEYGDGFIPTCHHYDSVWVVPKVKYGAGGDHGHQHPV